MKIHSKITISRLLDDYPSTISVFIKRKMPCIGCPAEAFHTIEDAARFNGIPLEALLCDLCNAVKFSSNHHYL
ncbi:MAG: DUF1858 domain-containing protein [Thermodesulfobacteriota bacterium]|nr:DUF1858 domain-containing protein [Thermodesulfobacteriota bacterium]